MILYSKLERIPRTVIEIPTRQGAIHKAINIVHTDSTDLIKSACGRNLPAYASNTIRASVEWGDVTCKFCLRYRRTFSRYISSLAVRIKDHCGVVDWQQATEGQLKMRDNIHFSVSLLSEAMNNNDEAIRIAFEQNKAT